MGDDPRPTYRHVTKRALTPLVPALPMARRWVQRLRRESLIVRVKTLALAAGATVEVDIAPDVAIDGLPVLEIYPQTWNRLRIGAGSRLGDSVRLSLRGGSLEIGEGTEIRRLGTYQVAGTARIGNGVVMSNGIVMHCADSIEVGDLTIVGEYTTITDSSHRRTAPDVAVHHVAESKPVTIGRNIWIGAHAVITRGVTVGDQSFVGAGAVVTKDVAPGWLVGGVPAKPLRELSVET
jgi:acetyltransferase-like isoleucine patch superfamily enzyme